MVREEVLSTHMARRVVAKAGVRPAPTTGGPSAAPTTAFSWWMWDVSEWPPDEGFGGPINRYSKATDRRWGGGYIAGATDTLGPLPSFGALCKFWLEGYTELRVTARVNQDHSNLRLVPGLGIPTESRIDPAFPDTPDETYFGRACFADTREYLNVGFGNSTSFGSGYSPILTSLYTVGDWVSIHEDFLEAGDVEMALWIKNTASSGSTTPWIGQAHIQVR